VTANGAAQVGPLLILGAAPRRDAAGHDLFGSRSGLVLRVRPETGSVETCISHVSPPGVIPAEDATILFKAGTLSGDRLYACTQTEVLVYALPGFERLSYISLPCFNDVHHVRPTQRGTLLIANTGLDAVLEVAPDGVVVREWSVLGEDTWARFSRDIDYRRVVSTKPHRSHPNYVFEVGDDVWVTRFEQRDAVCLTRPGRRIDIGVERPHDGVLHGGRAYFTTVDGHVVIGDPGTGRRERVIDLNAIESAGRPLGWCRGLLVLDPDTVVVGFSRLRATRFRDKVRWVRERIRSGALAPDLPTRIVAYDLRRRRALWRVDLEAAGMSAVFSIHMAAHAGSGALLAPTPR
jgi:prepilin-type processing-associated H-X9-DG protein